MPANSEPTTAALLRWAKRVPAEGDPATRGRWGRDWRVVRVLVERRAANSLRRVCELYLEKSGRDLTEKERESFYIAMSRRAKRALGDDYQRKYFPS